jgi:hypothetical protein
VTPHLVPVLLEQLVKQEEGQEQDESTWNLAMSAGTCLGLVARVAGNDVVSVVRGRTSTRATAPAAAAAAGLAEGRGRACFAVGCGARHRVVTPASPRPGYTTKAAAALLRPPRLPAPQVMPFVTTNIAKSGSPEDWRWREASTFAFGSIMEGPSAVGLVQLVQQAMPFLLQVGGQPYVCVRACVGACACALV